MEEKLRANRLAERLGTHINDDISIHFWVLPLLEEIVLRIEQIERLENENITTD